jgi:hypothetical protein
MLSVLSFSKHVYPTHGARVVKYIVLKRYSCLQCCIFCCFRQDGMYIHTYIHTCPRYPGVLPVLPAAAVSSVVQRPQSLGVLTLFEEQAASFPGAICVQVPACHLVSFAYHCLSRCVQRQMPGICMLGIRPGATARPYSEFACALLS